MLNFYYNTCSYNFYMLMSIICFMEDVNCRRVVMAQHEFPLYRGYLSILFVDEEVRVEDYQFKTNEKPFRVKYAHTFEVGITKNDLIYESILVAFNFGNEFADITHGIIAHEALHAARMLLESRGIRLCNKSDEAYAYLIDWIVERIYDLINTSDYAIVVK